MSTPATDPTVAQERTGTSDARVQAQTEVAQARIREHQEQERSRRWLKWIVPIVTGAWLGLIAWMVVTRAVEGIQVGLVIGIPGAALLALVGGPVSWACGGRSKTVPGPGDRLLRPRRPSGR